MMALAVATVSVLVLLCPFASFAQVLRNPCFYSDIGFIVDSSDSITQWKFNRAKNIIQRLTNAFEVKPEGSRAGLILFSNEARVKAAIGQYQTASEFNTMIGSLRKSGGHSYINKALIKATSELFGSLYTPSSRSRVIFLVSDGRQTGKVNLKALTRDLRAFRVRIIAIAIGDHPHLTNLRQLVEDNLDVVIVRTSSTIAEKVVELHNKGCMKKQLAFIKQCSKRIDLGFALDASGSIGKKIFPKVRKFTTDILEQFELSPTETHAGVIVYSTSPKLVIKMNEFYNLDTFTSELLRRTPWPSSSRPLNPKWMNGYTRIDSALNLTQNELFTKANGDRPNVKNALIFLTDGKQEPAADKELDYYSKPLKDAGVTIVAVGFGRAKVDELKKIASAPELVLSYEGGAEVLKQAVQDIVQKICNFCQRRVNLGFVLDASNTASPSFTKQKELTKRIANGFSVETQNGSQVTLISFSDEAKVIIPFTSNLELFEIDVDIKVESLRGHTYINKGLLEAKKEFERAAYKDVPKILLVMTDGRQTGDPQVVKTAADALRRDGITMFPIVTSRHRNEEVLKYIAGDEDHIIKLEDASMHLASKVINVACPGKTLEPVSADDIYDMIDALLDEM